MSRLATHTAAHPNAPARVKKLGILFMVHGTSTLKVPCTLPLKVFGREGAMPAGKVAFPLPDGRGSVGPRARAVVGGLTSTARSVPPDSSPWPPPPPPTPTLAAHTAAHSDVSAPVKTLAIL
ncbi:MAG UNVERIFIED_CONTAM: hypothetical protein LVR18_30900 [Planctomycetaceae bacterium]